MYTTFGLMFIESTVKVGRGGGCIIGMDTVKSLNRSVVGGYYRHGHSEVSQ